MVKLHKSQTTPGPPSFEVLSVNMANSEISLFQKLKITTCAALYLSFLYKMPFKSKQTFTGRYFKMVGIRLAKDSNSTIFQGVLWQV